MPKNKRFKIGSKSIGVIVIDISVYYYFINGIRGRVCEGLNSNNNKLLKSFQIEFGHGFLLFEIHLILIAKSLLFNV